MKCNEIKCNHPRYRQLFTINEKFEFYSGRQAMDQFERETALF